MLDNKGKILYVAPESKVVIVSSGHSLCDLSNFEGKRNDYEREGDYSWNF